MDTTTRLNVPEYSVGQLALALKRTVEDAYGQVRVRGEISGYKRAASGHAYLCLKDAVAVIDAVLWKTTLSTLSFRPEDGLEVVITGKLTTYPGRSRYQLIIERIEPAGVGALMALLAARKAKLEVEGLFLPSRKRALPYIPDIIGVVTSPTGAVIRDILHRLADRFPRHVLVWPVAVQGEAATTQLVAAITGFNMLESGGPIPRPDLLIVARGGGSVEDLWAFNEEAVVRAVAASAIPIISAVGHETDTTLVDFASDYRAPTPTAAAERAVPVLVEISMAVSSLGLRLQRAMLRFVSARSERTHALVRTLPSPRMLLGMRQQRYDEYAERLPRALRSSASSWTASFSRASAPLQPRLLARCSGRANDALLQQSTALDTAALKLLSRDARMLALGAGPLRLTVLSNRHERSAYALAAQERLLESLSPLNVLQRGYTVVRAIDGKLIKTAAEARTKNALSLQFADARVEVAVARQGRLL